MQSLETGASPACNILFQLGSESLAGHMNSVRDAKLPAGVFDDRET